MTDWIPFLARASDCALATSLHSDAPAYRVSLASAEPICSALPSGPKIWIDAGVDGLERWAEIAKPTVMGNPAYKELMLSFAGSKFLGDPAFQAKPTKTVVQQFVSDVLDRAIQIVPGAHWLSVPQLPYVDGTDRNKVNRMLAESTALWQAKGSHKQRLILPVIITNQRQLNKKTDRNRKIDLAISCLEGAGAQGIWSVDASLNDQDGTSTFEHVRFPGLVNFHEELNAKLGKGIITIGGPYWGLNVVLWARGLIDHAAIGLGNAHRYYIPGGFLKQGETRIALPPFRRTATLSPELKAWLDDAIKELPKNDPSASELVAIAKALPSLYDSNTARSQVAKFYKQWLSKLEKVPPSGRSLTLYQDLSSAYVLGKGLPDLPATEKTARAPGKIARQLMMNCL